MTKIKLSAILLAAVLGTAQAPRLFAADAQPAAAAQDQTDQWLAVLKSDADLQQKDIVCRKLAVFGNKSAIPVLAGFLGDEKLSHMARYALEPMKDPAVDAAFRDAAEKVKGKMLAGVIGSIGERRDVQAVPVLAKLLGDADPMIVAASAMALGKIGTAEAAAAVQGALTSAPAPVKSALYDGCLRCADALAAAGKPAEAIAICDNLLKSDAWGAVKMGAMRCKIVALGDKGIDVLAEQLKSDDARMFAIGLRLAVELPGPAVTAALMDAAEKSMLAKQVLLLQAIGNRHDPKAVSTVVKLAKSADPEVKAMAVRVLPQVADESQVPLLFEMSGGEDAAAAKAAQLALASLSGKGVDDAIIAKMAGDAKVRRIAIEALGQRRYAKAMPEVLKATQDADGTIRVSAIKALEDLAGPADVGLLAGVVVEAKGDAERDAAERTLSAVCVRMPDPAHADAITAQMAKATGPAKLTLIRVLRSVGGPKALAAVRDAMKDPNEEVRNTAVRTLCDWLSPEAADDMLALAKGGQTPAQKLLGLRGYIRITRDKAIAEPQRLTMITQASELATRDEEKRQILAAISAVNSPAALDLAATYLDTPGVKDEALATVVAMAEKLLTRQPAKVIPALEKAIAAGKGSGMAQRAQKALDQAKAATKK